MTVVSRSDAVRPLDGLRVLVTSGGDLGERLAAGVEEMGGAALRSPLVRTEAASGEALDAAVSRWNAGEYDWMLLTSTAGVAAVSRAGARSAVPTAASAPVSPAAVSTAPVSPASVSSAAVSSASVHRAGGPRVAAVGPATAAACAAAGIPADLVPERDYSARGLAAAFLAEAAAPCAVLFPASEIAGDELESALAAAGHRVDRVTAYRTLPTDRDAEFERAVASGSVDAILVSSGSAAREIATRFAPLPEGIRIVAIGRPTSEALADAGVPAAAVAEEHTAAGLLRALARAAGAIRPEDPRNPHPEGPLA